MEVKLTNTQDIECAIRTILSFIGEDPCREGSFLSHIQYLKNVGRDLSWI